MLFELRIRFICDEGEEMSVLELDDVILTLIEENTNTKVRGMRLLYSGPVCREHGRSHAPSN